jgi:hypothetical protein
MGGLESELRRVAAPAMGAPAAGWPAGGEVRLLELLSDVERQALVSQLAQLHPDEKAMLLEAVGAAIRNRLIWVRCLMGYALAEAYFDETGKQARRFPGNLDRDTLSYLMRLFVRDTIGQDLEWEQLLKEMNIFRQQMRHQQGDPVYGPDELVAQRLHHVDLPSPLSVSVRWTNPEEQSFLNQVLGQLGSDRRIMCYMARPGLIFAYGKTTTTSRKIIDSSTGEAVHVLIHEVESFAAASPSTYMVAGAATSQQDFGFYILRWRCNLTTR